MDSLLSSLLTTLPLADHPTVARYLESHLPLIKSRTLSALYYDLRYQKSTYVEHIPRLVQDAVTDYRLHAVLEKIIRFIMNQKNS
jgi:hypothetical protein